MSDNLLKATVDAIGESDNEMSGLLLTRTRQAHIHGSDTARFLTGQPTRLISNFDIFSAADVGKGLDVLIPWSGTPHGFEGSYIVATFIDAKNITVTKVDGTAPSFTTTTGLRWRFTTLRVETTLEFPTRDRLMRLWVGEEPYPIPYAEVVLTPTAQEFRGLGPQRFEARGSIDSGDPTTLTGGGVVFTADDVGRAVWVLPLSPVNGNEGSHLITAVAGDGKSATVNPAFAATEINVRFVVKDYSDDVGHLSGLRSNLNADPDPITIQSPVIDGSRSYSSLDRLRRAMLVDYAEGEELDRIGRRYGIRRFVGIDDETLRCLLKTLPYLPRCTEYGLELLLECLFPGGGYSIYEDNINFPAKVFVLLDDVLAPSTQFEGKTFMYAGADVTPPVDPASGGAAQARDHRELRTSTTTTAVTTAHTPIRISDVRREDDIDTQDMAALPTTGDWVFQDESDAGTVEADIFSLVSLGGNSALKQIPKTSPSDDGGRYELPIVPDSCPGSGVEISAWFRSASVNGFTTGLPWMLMMNDVSIGKKIGLFWGKTQFGLGTSPGSLVVPLTDTGINFVSDHKWHRFTLRRRTVGTRHLIDAYVDGKTLVENLDSSAFGAATDNWVSFGYIFQTGSIQNWEVDWDATYVKVRSDRNHWNLTRFDGVTNGVDAHFTSAAALFAVGDVGKLIRLHGPGPGIAEANQVNTGVWRILSRTSSSDVVLEGVESAAMVRVHSTIGGNFVDLDDSLFRLEDLGKQIRIIGSALGNNGNRLVLEVISPRRVRVNGATFTAEQGLSYKFNPCDGGVGGRFAAATAITWEIIDASTNTGVTLTLRDPLPAATTILGIGYTAVLSAQILRGETVANEGSLGADPNIWYPFYLFDVDRAMKALITDVLAAGVLPRFRREF